MVGMERSILPAIAEQDFHLLARSAVLSFIVVFGVTKAFSNYAAGHLSDRFGRKHILVAGWLVAAPVPFLLMWAPSWNWILVANAFLGVSQGLTWSTTVIMKIDLAGPRNRVSRWASMSSPATPRSPQRLGHRLGRRALRPETRTLLPRCRFRRDRPGLCRSSPCARRRHHVALEVDPLGRAPARSPPTQREVFWRTTLVRSQSVEHQPGWAGQQPQ